MLAGFPVRSKRMRLFKRACRTSRKGVEPSSLGGAQRAGNALSVGSGRVSLHHNCILGEPRSAEVTWLVACARGLRRWRSEEKSRNFLNRALRALTKDPFNCARRRLLSSAQLH